MSAKELSPQDKLERVLKEIHLMMARSEIYNHQPDKVIIDRKVMLGYLDQLTQSIFEMMETYEHTRESRNRAELRFKQKGKAMMDDASQKAEDVYAASVLYTADMLGKVQELIDRANTSMADAFRVFRKELRDQKDMIRGHETELEGRLNDLTDTHVYRAILEDIRREQRRRQREEAQEHDDAVSRAKYRGTDRIYTPAVTPKININESYFEKAGISPEDAMSGYVPAPEPMTVEKPDIKINLDSEYFRRKAAMETSHTDSDDASDIQSSLSADAEEPEYYDMPDDEYLDDDESYTERRADLPSDGTSDFDDSSVPDWKKRMHILMQDFVPKDLK